jgi:hypothetical protein
MENKLPLFENFQPINESITESYSGLKFCYGYCADIKPGWYIKTSLENNDIYNSKFHEVASVSRNVIEYWTTDDNGAPVVATCSPAEVLVATTAFPDVPYYTGNTLFNQNGSHKIKNGGEFVTSVPNRTGIPVTQLSSLVWSWFDPRSRNTKETMDSKIAIYNSGMVWDQLKDTIFWIYVSLVLQRSNWSEYAGTHLSDSFESHAELFESWVGTAKAAGFKYEVKRSAGIKLKTHSSNNKAVKYAIDNPDHNVVYCKTIDEFWTVPTSDLDKLMTIATSGPFNPILEVVK